MGQTKSINNKMLHTAMIVIFASIGGVLYGYDIGVIGGALLFMQKDITMTTAQMSFIVAAVLGGGSIATLVSGALADIFGRRMMIRVSAIAVGTGTIIVAMATNFEIILVGRLVQGIGIGIVTIVVPLYLSETAPPSVRGRCVSLFQLLLTGGIMLAYVIDLCFESSGNWRGMFSCVLVPTTLLLVGTFFIPRSPSWLFIKGKEKEALKSLLYSRTQEEADLEMEEMKELALSETKEKFVWKGYYWSPVLLAISVALLTQLTGINSILQFSTLIIKKAGLESNVISMLGSTGVGLLNFVMTGIAFLLIDKLGRRPLLLTGTAGIVIALTYSGCVAYFFPPSPLQGYLLIGGLCLFIIFFAVGPGVLIWVALSELLPAAIRSKGMGVCLFLASLTSTILTSSFLALVNVIGHSGVFWICGGLTLLYFLITAFWLPETKNKTLEEIEQHWIKDDKKCLYRY